MIFNASCGDPQLPAAGDWRGARQGARLRLRVVAALCDITIASEAATFQILEMEHYIPPTMRRYPL